MFTGIAEASEMVLLTEENAGTFLRLRLSRESCCYLDRRETLLFIVTLAP